MKGTKAKAGGQAEATLSPCNLGKGRALDTRVLFLGGSPVFPAIVGEAGWGGTVLWSKNTPQPLLSCSQRTLMFIHPQVSICIFPNLDGSFLRQVPYPARARVRGPRRVSGGEHGGTGGWKRGRALLRPL